MRFGLVITSALLWSATWCNADTLKDTFGQSQAHCDYTTTAPYGNCDVIGDEALYDIQKVNFTADNNMITLMIYLNSGAVQNNNGSLSLQPFQDAGLTLFPGDVFFYSPGTVYDPSDPKTIQYLKYGLALTDHGSFVAGGLYNITGGISTETAETALNNAGGYYRMDQTVLMTGSGTPDSQGDVSVASNTGGGAQYVITITVPTTTGLLALESSGQIGLVFSSADCGNDVIQGVVGGITTQTVAPEPGPAILMLSGAALLFGGRLWRKWAAQRG